MAKLKARKARAGTRQRCPRCQYQFAVPTLQQLAAMGDRTEEYPVFEGDYQPPDESLRAAESAAVADCHVCQTRNYAPEDQVGHELECPECGTMVPVTRRPEAPPTEDAPPPDEAEVFAFLDTYEAPPEEGPEPDEVHIPMTCTVCHTLMHGTPDMVGKHLLCPDCNTPVVVPPPPKSETVVAHAVDDEYALEEVARPPAAAQPNQPPAIVVVCTLCNARMEAEPDQVGQMITCTDCSTPAVVPKPPRPKPQIAAVGEYGTGEPAERPAAPVPTDYRRLRVAPDDPLASEDFVPYTTGYSKPPPPKWPFATGIVSFLWDDGTWPRLLVLTLTSFAALPLVVWALTTIATPLVGLSQAPTVIAAMILFAVGSLGGIAWGVVAAAYLVAVLQDTAEGALSIENWPEQPFLDWFAEFFFVFNSLGVSVACGVATVQIFHPFGPIVWLAIPLSIFLVFPYALLSMLHANSCFMPISSSLLGSFFSAWWAWALFYLEATLLAGLHLLAFIGCLYLMGLWGLLPFGIVTGPVLMVYFRLLGRLAWCIGEATGE